MILNDKYVIFLHKRYFKNKKLIKSLENKGIILIEFNKYIETIKKKVFRNQPTLLFDNIPYPSVNLLYINLTNDIYYNYTIFNQKYIDFNQDNLYITCIKLGAKKINYLLQQFETTITKQYNMTANVLKEYIKGSNIYEQIKPKKINYNIEHNLNLKNFIYKRQELKLLKLEYNIESDNINDFIYSILIILLEFKIINNFDKYSNINFKNSYNIEFYTDDINDKNEPTELDKIIFEKNNYITQIKEINQFLDKEETDIMLEISNIADNNDYIKNLNEVIKNKITEINSEIEYHNNSITKLKNELFEINQLDYDIQSNHILMIINNLKEKSIELSNNISQNEKEIEYNNKTIDGLYEKIKNIKEEKKNELDQLNGKLYDIYQLIEELKIEYN